MLPSSDGGGGAAPELIPNARAAFIVDQVNPSYTPPPLSSGNFVGS
jgi:hypothetical protein